MGGTRAIGAVRGHRITPEGALMFDLIYVATSFAFFALMVAFVRGLEVLGRDAALEERKDQ